MDDVIQGRTAMVFFRGNCTKLLVAGLLSGLLTGAAGAVGASGNPVRVDVDPGTTWYGFFAYRVIATQSGGFGVAWEEDTKQDQPTFPVIEGVKARIFKSNFAAVGAPRAPDISGRVFPSLSSLLRLGTDKLLLAYGTTRKISPSETRREIFGQTITTTNQTTAARRLLNTTANTGAALSRAAALVGGRGIFAWYDGAQSATTPSVISGRFISAAGAPLAANLDLSIGAGFALTDIKPLETGFVVLYRRVNTSSTQVRAKVFKADGTALGAAHALDPGASALPLLATFPDGRILVATWLANGSDADLVGQIYSKTWSKIGPEKTLIAAGTITDRVDFDVLADGGLVLARTFGTYPTYKHTVRRYAKNLTPVGTLYTVASQGYDFARIAVLSATRAVLVFRQRAGGRSRLVAQILKL